MPLKKDDRRLRLGVLGCGPIAQFAHFEAARKARNVDLYALCDVADDLRERMALLHQPQVTYRDYAAMLADPQVEAVLIATADQFHVRLCQQALEAGKHVLVEKPLGVTVEECEALARQVDECGRVLQVGHNRRFDPGISFAHEVIQNDLGQRIGLRFWYCDSTERYTMTDNLQPVPLASASARRPEGNPKADRRRYFMLTHGSHLVDTARFLGGAIASVQARLVERAGAYCWFAAVEFADGSVGHLDLTIAIQGDFEEGFRIYGEHGSLNGRVPLPWYHKSSEVEYYSARDRQFHRPLGADAHSYRRQLEGFAATILDGAPQHGAGAADGAASMRAMVALARSVESGQWVRLDSVTGGV
jgi:predicted dehydrogenase